MFISIDLICVEHTEAGHVSGIGRRYGPDGLLKYAETKTVAIARWMGLDPPSGVSNVLWQKMMVPMVRAVQQPPWQ